MIAALLLLGMVLMQAGNPIVSPPAPAPANITVHQEVTVQVPPPDPKATADMAAWSFEGIFVNVIAPTMVKWTNDLLDVPDFVRTTPPKWTYDNDAIKLMAETIRNVAMGLLVLLGLAWGLSKMAGKQPPLGRPFAAAALASANLIIWHVAIDGLNVVNNAIAAPSLASIVKPHLNVPEVTGDPIEAFGPAVLVIVYCVVVILIMISQVFRLGMVDILLVAGSLGLVMLGAEQTKGWYDRYVGWSVGWTASQLPVVIALRLAPILGVIGGGFVGALIGLAVLLLARQLPQMMGAGAATQQGQRNTRAAGGLVLVLRRLVAKV